MSCHACRARPPQRLPRRSQPSARHHHRPRVSKDEFRTHPLLRCGNREPRPHQLRCRWVELEPAMRLAAVAIMVTAALVASRTEAAEQSTALEAAIRDVREGEFERAMVSLDLVIRDLTARKEVGLLARAHLFMGAAYLGLGEAGLAQARFIQALRVDPGLQADPAEHPLRVMRAFDAA